jgi:D-3-phosphoglycerate dehydrogenase
MKILNTAPFDQQYLELLARDYGQLIAGIPEKERLLDNEEMINLIKKVQPDVLIVEVNEVNSTVLKQVDSLKVIAVCRSGTNNIDVQAATDKNITVINAPGRNAVAVAEWTIAMMIDLARNFHKGVNLIREGAWENMVQTCYNLEGYELSGRTAGIIGVGSVGSEIAKKLDCWGMKTLGYDPFVSQKDVEGIGIKMTTMEELLQESDYVVLLASVSKENQGMIDQKRISMMKPTAYFINVARAALVDEAALFNALQTGKIAGAALDVHSEEPLPPNSPWFTLNNVTLTPHLGGATKETITRHSQMVYEDLLLIKEGRKPIHLVNPRVWNS